MNTLDCICSICLAYYQRVQADMEIAQVCPQCIIEIKAEKKRKTWCGCCETYFQSKEEIGTCLSCLRLIEESKREIVKW